MPSDRRREFDVLRVRVLEGRSVSGVETRRVTKDGRVIDVSLSGAPLIDRHGAVTGVVNALVDITPRKRAEQALRESEAKYRTLVEDATYGILRASREGQILAVNPALVEMLAYGSQEELMGIDMGREVFAEPGYWCLLMQRCAVLDRVDGVETRWRRKTGTVITVRVSSRAVHDSDGTLQAVEIIAEDVTGERALESQLRQAQKMEAIGQLTGGIAHDFNNILTAVLSNAELIAGALPPDSSCLRSEVDDIRAASRRGAAMIRKLMAFSRREHLDIRQLDLADVTDDLAPMLTRLLPENSEVIVIRGNGPAMIRADRGAVEQIALNLATNARDAMPDGGTLRIETYATTIDGESGAGHRMGETSEYICLAVSDTGLGIDDAVRTKIFEPFFTTKPPGEGTGLGMSMVYGLIKQHGGLIKVDSEPRRGTTVQVCFPADPSRTRPGATPQAAREVRGGSETILLVEDEEAIRRASQRVLQHFGYEVRVAADGEEALALLSDPNVPVDLVITDVVMPKLGGRKLYDAAQKAGYDVRFIFSSGYAARDMRDGVELDPRLPFLRKPWMVADLLARVREVLDEPREKTAMIAVGPRAIVASRCNEVGIE